jgi:hypothetical protein
VSQNLKAKASTGQNLDLYLLVGSKFSQTLVFDNELLNPIFCFDRIEKPPRTIQKALVV